MSENPGGAGSGPVGSLKKLPKKWVWVGVAGAGGFVLWRYYQASRAARAAPAPDGTMDTGSVTAAPPGVGGGGNVQYAGTGAQTGDASITTNSAWTQAATDYLTNTAGYGAATVVEALGAYLANNPLTDQQIIIVRAALAAEGAPPQGTFTIKHTTAPAATVDPYSQRPGVIDPSSLQFTSTSAATGIRVQWKAVPGAKYYQGSMNGGYWFTPLSSPAFGVTARQPGQPRFKRGESVRVMVRAVNDKGAGPITDRVVKVT